MTALENIQQLKGIHPGLYINRLLNDFNISQRKLATSINVHHQTLNAIIKTKRKLRIEMALKIEDYFKLKEGTLLLLQVFYDIKKSKKAAQKTPNLTLLRPILFWDTNLQQIDWKKNKSAVINRVFSRGNKIELDEIKRFYGKNEVAKIIQSFNWQIHA